MNLFKHQLRLRKVFDVRLPAVCVGVALVAMAWVPSAIALPKLPGRPNIPPNGSYPTARGGASRARPKPPSNGSYVTTRGGASRGCGGDQAIVGLVPTERLDSGRSLIPKLTTGGYTTQARPDFWFHVPFGEDDPVELEFVLQDEADIDVYRTALATPSKAGLVKVLLPDDVPELVVGQRYRWFLKATLDCLVEGRSERSLQESKGWVERYQPEAMLARQLQSASPEQQVQLYQDAGYWFDALNSLAGLRLAEPGNVALRDDWDGLLGLYGIADEVAQADFADCCEAVVSESAGTLGQ